MDILECAPVARSRRQTQLNLPAEMYAELKRIAEEQDRTLVALVRRALPLLEQLR